MKEGELAHPSEFIHFYGADKARSASVRLSPECIAFGTWVLMITKTNASHLGLGC